MSSRINQGSGPEGVFRRDARVGETPDFALQRHPELWPDHAGRLVRFEHRNEPRTEVAEMFAVHTRDELKAVLDRIEAEGVGKPIVEQVRADADAAP